MLSLLSAPSTPSKAPGPSCGGKVGGALEVFVNVGGCIGEGELALKDCWPGVILRMKFIGAVGCASAREKRPDAATAEGGNGGGGWAWKCAAVRVNVRAVFAWEGRAG